MKFWTCGPFKEAQDRLETMVFKAEQMTVFLNILEESKKIDEILESGTTEEKLIAAMLKLEIDKKLETIIGIPDGNKEENDEIFGKTLLESFERLTE